MSAFQTAECRLCGKPIVWASNADGSKRYPLDPRAPVYHVSLRLDGTLLAEQRKEDPGRDAFMVTHFATCPKVGDLPRRDRT